MSIDKRFNIPADSKAKIFTDGLMGGKAIEIVYGTSAEIIPDDGTISAEASADLFEMAGSELGDLKIKLTTVMDGLATTLDGVNKLLAENTETLTSIINNVDGVTGSVDAMLSKEKAHLEEALASLTLFSKSLGDNAGEVDQIIDNLSAFSGQLAEANLIAEVEKVVGELNGVLAAASDESGSVGKLLKNAELYDNLTAASNNLSALLEDLKANPGRYLNVSVFSKDPYKKVEKVKAKAEKKALKREIEAAEKAAQAE
jgi:phospholipid/cholesterol/gamma-HCH transport system substrate-binding protein